MTSQLRTSVVWCWIAAAIALLGAALWANGGEGLLNRSMLASILVVSLLLGSTTFAIVLLSSPAMQRWAFREGTSIGRAKPSLKYFAVFTGSLGLGILLDAVLKHL